jgi:hypothetical protein
VKITTGRESGQAADAQRPEHLLCPAWAADIAARILKPRGGWAVLVPVREQVGYIFTGMAMVALGAYARMNMAELPYTRQVGDLIAICGVGLVCYSIAILAMSRNAYR